MINNYSMKSLTDIQKLEIVDLYIKGLNSVQISEIYNRNPVYIRTLLKKSGIVINRNRPHNKKYTYNETFFEKIDTEEKAYFLGLLYADGCNKTNRGTITLFLNEDDFSLINELSIIIGNKPITKEIGRGNRGIQYGICIHNKKMSKDLELLGVVRAKTFKLTFPTEEQVPSVYHSHFIRGYFDGDGHIGFSKNLKNYYKDKISLTGTQNLLKGIEEILSKLNVHSSWYARHPERNHNITSITISGRLQVIKVMNYLYSNSKIKMERKYKKFKEILNRYEPEFTNHEK